MPHDGDLLQTAVIFLLAAVLTVPLARYLQLGTVLGYLLAGVIIGPQLLGLIDDPQRIAHLSELGVVMLLFLIGLELPPRRLWVMRRLVFGVGLLQVVLTGGLIALVSALLFAQPVATAIILGLGLSLSSTASGLQNLAEHKEISSPHGRLAFAILLFQDIAAIPLIALVPLLSGHNAQASGAEGLQVVLDVLLCLAVLIISSRFLLRPLFRVVVRTGLQEVLTATALLVVIGTAWLMSLAGLSMALGAFMAGLLLADTEFRHELEAQIEPFKGLLLGLFFISVGMGANLELLRASPLTVLGLTLLLIALKLPLLVMLGQRFGQLTRAGALRLGMVLAGGGEFAFVVFQLGHEHGLFSARLYDLLVLVITLSMALLPILQSLVQHLQGQPPRPEPVPEEYCPVASETPRVVIAGMGRMGQIVARILHAQKIPFVALDTAVESISFSRSMGHAPVFYGDPLHPEILRAIHTEQAEFFIIATDDPETNLKTAELVRRLYPGLKIIARARNRKHAHRLMDLDVLAIRETYYSSLEISRHTLLGLGLSPERTDARLRRFQRHDAGLLAMEHLIYNDEIKVQQTALEAREELERLFEADRQEEEKAAS